MKTATKELAEGDLVYLKDDPTQARGIITEAGNTGQWYVAWVRGGAWIYHSVDLVRVET